MHCIPFLPFFFPSVFTLISPFLFFIVTLLEYKKNMLDLQVAYSSLQSISCLYCRVVGVRCKVTVSRSCGPDAMYSSWFSVVYGHPSSSYYTLRLSKFLLWILHSQLKALDEKLHYFSAAFFLLFFLLRKLCMSVLHVSTGGNISLH